MSDDLSGKPKAQTSYRDTYHVWMNRSWTMSITLATTTSSTRTWMVR